MCFTKNNRGFTLIELSVVLVIIGLMAGAIVGGRALIHAAELNKVISDINGFKTAANAFKMQYDALPGDFKDAFSYFGSTCYSATASECNGNGDNVVGTSVSGGNFYQEALMFWRHMYLAGIFPLALTGDQYLAPTLDDYAALDINLPAGPLTGTGYLALNGSWNVGGAVFGRSGNGIHFGSVYNEYLTAGALKPSDAKNIDTKIDDGRADRGDVRTSRIEATLFAGGQDCTGGADPAFTTAGSYAVASTNTSCRMYFFID